MATNKKIIPNTDDFCIKCMEWRKFDKDGKCIVCNKKIKYKKMSVEEYNRYLKDLYGGYEDEE